MTAPGCAPEAAPCRVRVADGLGGDTSGGAPGHGLLAGRPPERTPCSAGTFVVGRLLRAPGMPTTPQVEDLMHGTHSRETARHA